MNEQYRKLAITVLAKALDDICPKFLDDSPEEREQKIQERIKFFALTEPEIDTEWEQLEIEAEKELKEFIKERELLIKKIKETDNSKKVEKRANFFEKQKQKRIIALHKKLSDSISLTSDKLKETREGTKKHAQLSAKLQNLEASLDSKIRKTEARYNTIIKNTLNSENSAKIEYRIAQSKRVWEKKYEELRDKHRIKESIHENRRMELDQIRIALKGFEEELPYIEHWCLTAGVSLKRCYTEVINRAKLVKRDTKKLEKILKEVSQ